MKMGRGAHQGPRRGGRICAIKDLWQCISVSAYQCVSVSDLKCGSVWVYDDISTVVTIG